MNLEGVTKNTFKIFNKFNSQKNIIINNPLLIPTQYFIRDLKHYTRYINPIFQYGFSKGNNL